MGHCYTGLSKLNQEHTELTLAHVFSQPIINWNGSPAGLSREKNWAFFEHEGALLVIWKTLPCTVVFAVQQPDVNPAYALTAVKAVCYDWAQAEGSISPADSVHGSGHPVLWQQGGVKEYLMMVHLRSGPQRDFRHFLLRLEYKSLAITHVSKGPVLSSQHYELSGFDPHFLVVGSYHFFWDESGVPSLMVLFGEGDKYPCFEALNLEAVEWTTFANVTTKIVDTSTLVVLPKAAFSLE